MVDVDVDESLIHVHRIRISYFILLIIVVPISEIYEKKSSTQCIEIMIGIIINVNRYKMPFYYDYIMFIYLWNALENKCYAQYQ